VREYPGSFSERDICIKSPATITEQLKILKSRGLVIDDVESARKTLETINYYRLVHYFAVFLQKSGKYIDGTHFEDGVRLYNFDKKLRSIVLIALEEIEIAARAAISNYHATRYGTLGYLQAESFDRKHNHRGFMNKVGNIISKNAELSFVRHHNKKYGGTFPLWVLMEMFSFGTLAVFFADLKIVDKKEIAEYYFGCDSRNVENWLENLAVLRNRCAHYNRMYGNPLPGEIRDAKTKKPSSLFEHMLAARELRKCSDNVMGESWGKSFSLEMQELFDDYKDLVNPELLGFPKDFKKYFTIQEEFYDEKSQLH